MRFAETQRRIHTLCGRTLKSPVVDAKTAALAVDVIWQGHLVGKIKAQRLSFEESELRLNVRGLGCRAYKLRSTVQAARLLVFSGLVLCQHNSHLPNLYIYIYIYTHVET